MAATTGSDSSGGFRPVKSANRTVDVLEAMAAGPCTLAELARLLDIPKSSLHGLLRTLVDRGWVQSVDGGNRFRLGLRAVQVGATVLDGDPMLARAAPVLDRLAEATGETVQHGRLDGDTVLYLAKRDSPHPVRLISTVGSRLPVHATALGKALLATRDDEAVRDLLRFPLAALTPHTRTCWEALAADLAAVRERGYAVDDGEAAEDLCCFAVAVPGDSPATDAISVSVPAYRLSEHGQRDLVAQLLTARSDLDGGPRRAELPSPPPTVSRTPTAEGRDHALGR